jgi:hypothetical protein
VEIRSSEKRCCIHIVLKTSLEETGSKYIQGWPNEKREVEIAFGVGPERVGNHNWIILVMAPTNH